MEGIGYTKSSFIAECGAEDNKNLMTSFAAKNANIKSLGNQMDREKVDEDTY